MDHAPRTPHAEALAPMMARIRGAWEKEPAIDGWGWDEAGGHKGQEVQALAAPREVQPPYAPELNPVERFFQALWRALEGRVYPDPQAKQAALEPILNLWQADPERMKQLCGWGWIRDTLEALPADTQAA